MTTMQNKPSSATRTLVGASYEVRRATVELDRRHAYQVILLDPGTVLVTSVSEPDRLHRVTTAGEGTCDCQGYAYRQRCRHLDAAGQALYALHHKDESELAPTKVRKEARRGRPE